MNWLRVRTDNKKNERKETIYQAALTLFKDKGYERVSFNAMPLSRAWVASHIPHPQFLDLTTILFISLEANSSYEQ